MKHFALAGNPNCGKTTLFNTLTGSTAHVGNWPGVTVDKKEGTYKKLEEPISIVDLPGIYSLSPYTPEEVISRNYIIEEKPDCVINIVDATNLERNLYLTTQILEIDVPVIVALNMIDVVEKNHEIIDCKKMEEVLGVPVVTVSALKESNLDELMARAYLTSKTKRKGTTILKDSSLAHLINDCRIAFEAIPVPNPLFHAIKLVELDELEAKDHPNLVQAVEQFKKTFKDDVFGADFEAIVADQRYKFICKKAAVTKKKIKTESNEKNKKERENDSYALSDKIDKVLTNKWAGIPIFLLILFLIFHLTFSENLFFLGGLFKNAKPSFAGSIYEGLIWTDSGINSLGVILQNLVTNTTDWFTDLVSGWLESAPSWVSGLICDGILSGVFAVLSFVPQILLLFLFFSILEDSGYMARIAFILDRIFRRFGLSGRAFMPMIMGFGCSVPAMINTRTLADEKEKIATVRVIPFFSCGAKLPILTAIAGGIIERIWHTGYADLITYGMYVLGMTTAFVAVLLMRSTSLKGKIPPFIMELPQYHLPQFKSLMIHLWDKLKHFIEKAFTVILASTIVIWFLQSFTFDWSYIEQANPNDVADKQFELLLEDNDYKEILANYDLKDEEGNYVFENVVTYYKELDDNQKEEFKNKVLKPVFYNAFEEYYQIVHEIDYKDTSDSILAGLGKLVTPVFTPLGFGAQLNKETGWVFAVSAVTGLIAKENVIATLNVLAQATSKLTTFASDNPIDGANEYLDLYLVGLSSDGVNAVSITIDNTYINVGGLLAFIAFNMLTIPCFAAVATAKAELPEGKFGTTLLFWVATSFVGASVIYLSFTWPWTIAISVFVAAAVCFAIWFYNRHHSVLKTE